MYLGGRGNSSKINFIRMWIFFMEVNVMHSFINYIVVFGYIAN